MVIIKQQDQAGRWGFLLLEMALIVLSILVAFALDAWWGDQIQHKEEQARLESLRSELVASQTELDEIIESVTYHGKNVDTVVDLLMQAEGKPVVVSNKLLGSIISWRTSDVSISTLEALRASGYFGLVTNADLRNALAAFPALLHDVQEDEAMAMHFVENILAPVLAREGLATAAYSNRLGFNDSEHGGETTVTPSAELIGLLTARQVHINFSRVGLPVVREYMSNLILMIDNERQPD